VQYAFKMLRIKYGTASIIFLTASIGFLIAAIYHLLSIFISLNGSGFWHNLLFVVINLWFALKIKSGKKYFYISFTVLYIQQLFSHGSYFINSYQDNRIDWLSVLVLIFLSAVYIAKGISILNDNVSAKS
jgi:hypothetical protein